MGLVGQEGQVGGMRRLGRLGVVKMIISFILREKMIMGVILRDKYMQVKKK